ncbi:molybdate ABC transporter substrate-binding protein [Corynebacterium suicordis]
MRSAKARAGAAVAVGALVCALVPGCSDSSSDANSGHSASARIFAAASMKPVGDELTEAFARSHDGAELTFNYGGSSDLVRQINQGAPADMFISADQKNMDTALKGKDFEGAHPSVIATNTLVLAVPANNPAHVESLKDLPGKRVAVCAQEVPCGTIAHQVLEDNHIALDNPSEEASVSDVSTKVGTGEVDAGFVYSTDARAMSDKSVTSITIDGVKPNEYPAALTLRGSDNDTAKAFAEWLRGADAQKILTEHGFGPAK